MSTKDINQNSKSSSKVSVVVIGLSKCGKSSLINSLSNKNVMICQGQKRRVELQCEDSASSSKNPEIISNPKANITFYDYKGFESSDGFNPELVNSFIKEKSFQKNAKTVKYLLVAPASEFEEYFEEGLEKYIEVLLKKFSNNKDQLISQLGLVITKGDVDINGADYIEQLADVCPSSLKKWCDIFKSNFDHIFTFPYAQKENIGKTYQFDDQKRILEFLHGSGYKANQTSASSSSNEKKKTKSSNFYKVQEIVRSIFSDIFMEYRKDKSTSNLRTWLYSLKQLSSNDIDNLNDLQSFFKRNIPNSSKYDEYFQELGQIPNLDSYVDLQESLSSSVYESIQELESLYQQSEMIEKQKERELEINRKEEEQRLNHIEKEREREQIERDLAQHRYIEEEQRKLIESSTRIVEQQQREIERLKASRNKNHRRRHDEVDGYDGNNRNPSISCIIE